jgi:hypothetical protein
MRTHTVGKSARNNPPVLKTPLEDKNRVAKKTPKWPSVNERSSEDGRSSLPIMCELLGEPSVTDLAVLYCAWPESALQREDLLEAARVQLSKYDLESEDLDRIAPVLARTLHMLIEQNGGRPLADGRELEIERQVLEWCGCQDPMTIGEYLFDVANEDDTKTESPPTNPKQDAYS